MYVLKASGKRELFDPRKLMRTCLRAGASREVAEEITKEVEKDIYDGISTKEILNRTLRLLKKKHPGAASRYDLKRAIMSLGPTGFPFEKFFAEILESYGYETKVGRILEGKCASQEIDIIAKKGSRRFMIECKYHNELGIYTGLKVALYTHARFLDLNGKFDQAWLVCNTKLSYDAVKYANCVGLKVTSWRYPGKESLEQMIESKKLYPVTLLKSIDDYEKGKLMSANLLLVKNLIEYDIHELKRKSRLKKKSVEKIVEEAEHILE